MATPDGQNISFPSTIYQEVKDWAAKQEAFEEENKAPAPLTDVQRAFLEELPRPLPSPSPSSFLDANKDYVSLLYQYRQINPTGNEIDFVDDIHPIRDAQGNPRWTCTVPLSETSIHEPGIKSFPAAGFGLGATGCCPPFAKKRDAKQYAAMCAMDWLDKKSLLPGHLQVMAFPQKSRPVLQNQPAKRPSEGSNGVLSPLPKRKTKGTTGIVDVNDETLPATQRVSTLCHSMGLRAPTYVLTHADSNLNYLYDGHVDFGDDEDSFDLPEGVGRIKGVRGKDGAKQEMAEQLLPHLLRMYRGRMADWKPFSA